MDKYREVQQEVDKENVGEAGGEVGGGIEQEVGEVRCGKLEV